MQRTAFWVNDSDTTDSPSGSLEQHLILSPESTHQPDPLAAAVKTEVKTRGAVAEPVECIPFVGGDLTRTLSNEQKAFRVDKRSYKVFKSLFHVPSSESSEYLRAIKWDDFRRAMISVGFSAEKLHGSAWQFAPINDELSSFDQLSVSHGLQLKLCSRTSHCARKEQRLCSCQCYKLRGIPPISQ